jgi:hypothetical protein
MLRVERAAGVVTLVSRLARAPAVGVLAGVLLAGAAAARSSPALAAPLALVAVLVVLLGGRTVRARFARGRVLVRHAAPFRRDDRALAAFTGARVETIADARHRKAERLAQGYRERSGGAEMPPWLAPPRSPGANDHLRRVVLVAPTGELLEVTAWVADDLEAVRAEIEALLR